MARAAGLGEDRLRAVDLEPLLNANVLDRDGKWLGRADLVWPEYRKIAEYDGDQHRTSTGQYDRDVTRIEEFTRAAWSVVRVRSHALFRSPADVVGRVSHALRTGGWLS